MRDSFQPLDVRPFGTKNNFNNIPVSIYQFLRSISRRYFSVVHDGNSVAEVFRFVHEVRHQNNRGTAVADGPDKIIEEYYFRVVNQRQGY